MTLEAVGGGAPEVPGVEVASAGLLPGDGDDPVTLGPHLPVPQAQDVARPGRGVDVHLGVSPGPQGAGRHPHPRPAPLLAEAAGVAVQEVIPAPPLKQDRGLVVPGGDLAAGRLRPQGVPVVRAQPLHHHRVVVPPGVIGDVGGPLRVMRVHHEGEVSAPRHLDVGSLSNDGEGSGWSLGGGHKEAGLRVGDQGRDGRGQVVDPEHPLHGHVVIDHLGSEVDALRPYLPR